MKYDLYLIFFEYHLVWLNIPNKYFSEENRWQQRFSFMHCPSEAGDVELYAKEKLERQYEAKTKRKFRVIIKKMEGIDVKGGRILPRVFEVIYGIDQPFFMKRYPGKVEKRSIRNMLNIIRSDHPGTVNNVFVFVDQEVEITDNNLEEVIRGKIPKTKFQHNDKTFKVLGIKEIVSIN